MKKLAINGGEKVRNTFFPAYKTIGEEEKEAVIKVIESGMLSKYLGCWHKDFMGGPEVRALEQEWAEYYGVKYAVAVNSATSGLYCALGAAGIAPGDEVIVSPYTMAASATAPLIYNAIPVFADIEAEHFCLDPDSVEEHITEKTKAIIAVDIFGQPYHADKINEIAKRHNLLVIEDAAQAPGARYGNKFAGTLGDMGVYSLNYHKHIHCGEGGVIVTNNDELAERLRLIRNHAEAVVEAKGVTNLNNMIGFNLRMTELEAAVARQQLKKLNWLLEARIKNVNYLSQKLRSISCLEVPAERPDTKHAYYVHPIKYKKQAGVTRELFVEAVKAELMPTVSREENGVLIGCGYVKPLYLQPMFQKQIGYGGTNYPFSLGKVNYEKGICPVCERMHFEELITHEMMHAFMSNADLDDVYSAFRKVSDNLDELAEN